MSDPTSAIQSTFYNAQDSPSQTLRVKVRDGTVRILHSSLPWTVSIHEGETVDIEFTILDSAKGFYELKMWRSVITSESPPGLQDAPTP